MIPFKVKLLTKTAKAPTQENAGDLWDLYADGFCAENLKDINYFDDGVYEYENRCFVNKVCGYDYNTLDCNIEQDFSLQEYNHEPVLDGIGNKCKEIGIKLHPQGRILVKTGISLELPKHYKTSPSCLKWSFEELNNPLNCYAVADIRPRSGLALKHGITVLNTPGTIDNSYRKEIGVILYNAGHEPYTITKGDKIAQMLIRPLYPSKIKIVENIEDTGRGGYGSTGK